MTEQRTETMPPISEWDRQHQEEMNRRKEYRRTKAYRGELKQRKQQRQQQCQSSNGACDTFWQAGAASNENTRPHAAR